VSLHKTILFFGVLISLQSRAQSSDPVLRPDSADCIIPFTLVGKLIVIQASADTSSGNFILDTGAPGLVLNNTYFRDYPVTVPHGGSRSDINGSSEHLEQTTVNHFRFGAMHYFRMGADLVPLGHLERARGLKIMGLIGVSFFKECEMIIDYKANIIRLHHILKRDARMYRNELLSDTSKYAAYPIELRDNRILIKTRIAQRDVRFAIDYAAETSILDSRLPERILDSVTIDGRILLSGVGTEKVEALSGELTGLHIGEVKIPSLPVIITRLDNTCFGGVDCINGVLGYDFILSSTIAINFRKRILYILK
jgi:hypothetical protein